MLFAINIGQLAHIPRLYLGNSELPIVPQTRDLGVVLCDSLSPTPHVNDIVSRAHKRAMLISRAFISRDVSTLIRAYLTYVRPLLEYNSVIWSPYSVKDIQAIERVQRRFTKNLPGFRMYSYSERLHRLNMQSLELSRLLTDLVWCYKVVFCLVDINVDDFFSFSNLVVTRGHQYKLYKKHTVSHVRATFFSERVINVWNSLPKDVDFSSLL